MVSTAVYLQWPLLLTFYTDLQKWENDLLSKQWGHIFLIISEKPQTHQVVKVAYYLRSFNCIGAHSLKKIWREMKIFLWQNVLNVLNGTTKCLRVLSCVFTDESVEWKCMRCWSNIKTEKEKKKIFYFYSKTWYDQMIRMQLRVSTLILLFPKHELMTRFSSF